MKSDFHVRDTCRLCGNAFIEKVLELPDTPLANEFVPAAAVGVPQDKFPLFLSRCSDCSHVQLPVVVDPVRLFRNYVYVSGTSKSFVEHFYDMATEVVAKHNIPMGSLVVEIGSNDGTALRAFKQAGMSVLGVDPALEIAKRATDSGIPTLPKFFTRDLGTEIRDEHGPARIVVANNVFAHADDLAGIVDGVVKLLHPEDGLFIFEVQYLAAMMEHNYFDMIYHEHLSYHALAPLIPFLAARGLNILECQEIPTHGGSIRVTAGFRKLTPVERSNLDLKVELEETRLNQNSFDGMQSKIDLASQDLQRLLGNTLNKVWGFGAPAKLTTLFYGLKLEQKYFKAIIDDNPLKQGLCTPGEHIPVVSIEDFKRNSNDREEILIFAWNFATHITHRFKETKHVLYIPLPRLLRLN